MTARIFLSTDASAPTLANSQNSLAALLYACLVTGYGSRTALGWTREFTGTGKAIFKAGSGSKGHMVYVDDDLSGASYTYANLLLLESATSISAHVRPDTVSFRWYKSYSGVTALQWMLVGTERGFWFGRKSEETNSTWSWYYCGELQSGYPTTKPDLWPMVLSGSVATDYDYPFTYTTALATASNMRCLGGPDGYFSPCYLAVNSDSPFANAASIWPGPKNELVAHGRHVFYGTETSAKTALRANGGAILKGRLPGHLINASAANFNDAAAYPEFTITNGFKTSATYKAFRSRYDAGANVAVLFLVETSNTWGV
jgi:hypothetical protein